MACRSLKGLGHLEDHIVVLMELSLPFYFGPMGLIDANVS